MWGFISFAAFGTLPEPIRRLYGVRWSRARQLWLGVNLTLLRLVRPLLPRRFRLIGPARWALDLIEGKTDVSLTEQMRRSR
jgi:uncharacterized protein (DUF2236 family)